MVLIPETAALFSWNTRQLVSARCFMYQSTGLFWMQMLYDEALNRCFWVFWLQLVISYNQNSLFFLLLNREFSKNKLVQVIRTLRLREKPSMNDLFYRDTRRPNKVNSFFTIQHSLLQCTSKQDLRTILMHCTSTDYCAQLPQLSWFWASFVCPPKSQIIFESSFIKLSLNFGSTQYGS